MELLVELRDYTNNYDSGRTIQYKNEWEKSISEFKNVAQKLKKMTSLLKTQEWYLDVGKYLNRIYHIHL